jgi:hypothetical protein
LKCSLTLELCKDFDMLTLSAKYFLDVDYVVLGFHTRNSYHVNTLLYRIV